MTKQPNILFINTDQQRYDSLGFTGHRLVKTPNLDRLAREGMVFTRAFTPAPLSCPARQTLLCGLIPEVHGGLWNYDNGSPIKALEPSRGSWVTLLRDAGYESVYLGKWHVNPDAGPEAFGYDRFLVPGEGPMYGPLRRQTEIKDPGLSFHIGMMEDVPLDETHTHRLAAAAVEQIEQLSRRDGPWHLRLDFPHPHLPCCCAEPFASMVQPEEIPPWPNFDESFENKPYIQRQQIANWGLTDWTWHEWSIYLAAYFGMISQVDDAIGRVLDALDRLGLAEDTVVVYTTDHGDAAGSHRMMDKHYVMYEEEVHVPLVIRWPGRTPGGTVCEDFLVHYLDLGPTLLEIAGVSPPPHVQGRSFLPQLTGQPASNPRSFVFSSYNGQQFGLYSQRMIRDDRYKYIWNATDRDELYDLQQDPDELVNLTESLEQQDRRVAMRRTLWTCFNGLGDSLMQNPWIRQALNPL